MVWFFGRGNETVRVQTTFDNSAREYVLEVEWGNRAPETHRFRERADFESRVISIEEQLRKEAWAQIGGPEILREGWRGPFTN